MEEEDSWCQLLLDNGSGVFRPGQAVTGTVILTLKERTLVKSFAYKFSGYASTRWEKSEIMKKRKFCNSVAAQEHTEFYEDREDYLASTNYMIGSESALPHIIDTGRYAFTFSVRLPAHCPRSFEGEYGHIRYNIDVCLTRPHSSELLLSRRITVTQPLDLRADASLLEPANQDCSEQVRRSKFWQRPLQLHVNMPQTGYVPSERISVYVKLLNDGRVGLHDLTYKLNTVTTYTGYSRTSRKSKRELVTTNLLTSTHSLRGQNDGVIEHLESLQLPPAVVPSLHQSLCRCLQQSYEVEVSVRTSNTKRAGVGARIPIVVGTISLHDRQRPRGGVADKQELAERNRFEAPAPPADLCGAQLGTTENGADANLSVSLTSLSSSFKEADYMTSRNLNEEFRHRMSSGVGENFRPKYLYYNLDAEPSEATSIASK